MLQFFFGSDQASLGKNVFPFPSKKSLFLFLLFGLILLNHSVFAQSSGIYGLVTTESGEKMPYTNVVVLGQAIGTSTNYDGEYSLKLKPGNYKVSFQFIGYKSEVREISLSANEKIEINPALSVEKVFLNAVEVSAKAENPAYEIIRNAQKNREKYLKENKGISYSIYTKLFGKAETNSDNMISFFGTMLTPRNGIFYLSESVNRIYQYEYNNTFQELKASLVLGDDLNASQNNPVFINLYENRPFSVGSQMAQIRIASPIATDAFSFYDYDFLGSFEEAGRTIHKIELIPKGSDRNTFTGEIYVIDESWRIYQSHLFLKSIAGDIEISTQTIKDDTEETFLPFSSNLFLEKPGSNLEVYYHNVAYDYNFNATKPEQSEQLNKIIDKSDYSKPASWWKSSRKVELTEDEKLAYQMDQAIKEKPYEFKKSENDSLYQSLIAGEKKKTPLQLFGLAITTGEWKLNEKLALDFSVFTFNTVEGGVLKPEIIFRNEFRNNHRYKATAAIRYGFASKDFYGRGSFLYELNPATISTIELEGGSYVEQISGNKSISNIVNLDYTLLAKLNYQKLYRTDYLSLDWRRELVNGFDIRVGASYDRRYALPNSSDYNWYNEEDEPREFTPNQAFIQGEYRSFQQNDILESGLLLSYQPKRKFDLVNGRKIPLSSKYPIFRAGVDVGILDTEYSRFWGNVSDGWSLNSVGFSKISVSYGQYLSRRNLTPIDFFHFMGNQTAFSQNQRQFGLAFQLLDYYQHSTSGYFAGANFEHDFDGAILGRIPLLKKIGLKSYFMANYLQTAESPRLLELGVGLTSSFYPIRLNYYFGYENERFLQHGFILTSSF
ncbi:CarboxypepD_reg-like domain-containing protein [Marivirga sericea]|uniref:CarboxypepD_reg-like domain-containing protein n=1 Tax=Marivirga sericea TaxID=1028 RepID=A0A1X7KGY4_9BACT|nr:DUF5686 and carboxypeptidase regulatory-like domain-containing protein [Marivirga sericea]SMG39870.1 CarboxypepD_reg-like domain-containing protein [Marivirga sericea]